MSQKESSEKRGLKILERPSARAAMMRARLVTLFEPGTRIVASGGFFSGVISSCAGRVGRRSSTGNPPRALPSGSSPQGLESVGVRAR